MRTNSRRHHFRRARLVRIQSAYEYARRRLWRACVRSCAVAMRRWNADMTSSFATDSDSVDGAAVDAGAEQKQRRRLQSNVGRTRTSYAARLAEHSRLRLVSPLKTHSGLLCTFSSHKPINMGHASTRIRSPSVNPNHNFNPNPNYNQWWAKVN